MEYKFLRLSEKNIVGKELIINIFDYFDNIMDKINQLYDYNKNKNQIIKIF